MSTNDDTSEDTIMAKTTCRNCASVIIYEAIMVFGKDLGICLHTVCESCESAAAEATIAKERAITMQQRETVLAATIPPDLLATDINHPSFNRQLWRAVSQWRPGPDHRSIGIIGDAGQCKTRVLSLLAKRNILGGTRVVWTSAVRLKDAAADRSSRLHNVASLAREHFADCLQAPWLFLDDIGKNEWTPAFESQLFQILDHRINYRLPFAWSSNDHPENFSQVISVQNASPIIGRLLDRCALLDLRAGA
jgi:DNA replication protein DnaC